MLRADDVVAPTYRGHAAYLAKGGDLRGLFAELYGKSTGIAGGKGGSMHLIDMSHNVLGASAVVGTTIPVAVGYALALKRRRPIACRLRFFGDGATEEGVFGESLNFASLQKLPVLFVCENNCYAIHTPITRRWATDGCANAWRPTVYRLHQSTTATCSSFATGFAATSRMRRGEGPAFIECRTYRWREHVGPNEDYDQGYRARERFRSLAETTRCSAVARRCRLIAAPRSTPKSSLRSPTPYDFAEDSPFPAIDKLHSHVFAGDVITRR